MWWTLVGIPQLRNGLNLILMVLQRKWELAGCGAICRGSDGVWIKGFVSNLGMCHAFMAELWSAYYALIMASQLNLRYLILESDSQALLNVLISENIPQDRYFNLLKKIKALLNQG